MDKIQSTPKIRVAVLYGGRSTEHEISLVSAGNIINNLDPALFEVLPIKIDKEGSWFLESQPDRQKLFAPVWLNEPETARKTELAEIRQLAKPQRLFDVIFPVMHGTYSEDGTIQGLLELADVPYVGCGVLASAIGMDKDVARRLVSQAGFPTVPYLVFKQARFQQDAASIEQELRQHFALPLFVKPANQGSSVGVTKVKSWAELAPALDYAFRYDTKALVDQGIPAIELEVAMLETLDDEAEPFASLVGEVRPRGEFNSYVDKYTQGELEILVPAPIPDEIQVKTRGLAKEIFKTLGAEGLARVDFFLDKNTKQVYFNEINTIPGFTPTSLYPIAMTASGFSYSALLTQLVHLALKRHKKKQSLVRNYKD